MPIRFTIMALFFLSALCLNAQNIPPHPDNSVTNKEFVEMGIPALEKTWSIKEYETTLSVLRKIKELDKYSLPRYKSKHSNLVFERLINKENLGLLLDNNYDLQSRIDQLNGFSTIPAQMVYLYAEENKPAERFGAEVLQCMLFSAELSNSAVLLLEELKMELGEEGNQKALEEGSREVKKAHNSSIQNILSTVEERYKRYDIFVLDSFAKQLVKTVPTMFAQLEADDKKQLKSKIEHIAKKHNYKSIRSAFKKLCKKLK